jgi:hypothetical protein
MQALYTHSVLSMLPAPTGEPLEAGRPIGSSTVASTEKQFIFMYQWSTSSRSEYLTVHIVEC